MKAKEKLIRARIQIQNRSPFFAYLSLYLKFHEQKLKKGEEDPLGGNPAGVDVQGNLYYKPEWVEGLSDDECIGLILHEIMHLSFLHLIRRDNRNPLGWNIAADIAVNKVIQDNHFVVPDGALIPQGDEITIFGQTIENLGKKTAEIIYDELKAKTKKGGKDGKSGGFDAHMQSASGLSPEEKEELKNQWLNRVEEAYVSAKMRGEVPSGIEQLIGKLHESKVNWKNLLQRHLLSYIPYDQTYAKPNKKSISAGYYMPDYVKEKIKVAIAIDTSGSIAEQELQDFLSEIAGMARAYQDRIEMDVICHDVDVQSTLKISNGGFEKIKQLKIKGGGGTSHKPVFDYITKNIPDCRVAVFLTDGYSDLEEVDFNTKFSKIFVISRGGSSFQLTRTGKDKHCNIVELKD